MRNKKLKITAVILLVVTSVGQMVPVMAKNATITLVSVTGNKITYIEQETQEQEETSTEDTFQGDDFSGDELPDGTFPGGDSMPEGFSKDSMPEDFSKDGMPEGFSKEDMPEGFSKGSMPEGFSKDNMPEGFSGNGMGNTKTVYLSVAVPVHVGDTEVRTFTILQAGDILEVTLETDDDGEEVITEIWLKKVSEGS